LFQDLDINVISNPAIFDMFDSNRDGLVSVSHFIDTAVKMRGELQKSDMIASWVSLRELHASFAEFEQALLANQRKMLDFQSEMGNSTSASVSRRSSRPLSR